MTCDPQTILNFWFTEIGPDHWFEADGKLDSLLREKFLDAHEKAVRGDLKTWEETPEGALALLLLLNMFPHRMFRGTPQAYATDDLAVELARTAIIKHFDDRIDRMFKLFFYLPFAHSEHDGNQRLAVFYIRERVGKFEWTDSADARLQVIQLFERFPQRNAILERESTPEEKAYLAQLKPTAIELLLD